ncbi:MAG: fructose-6-phosphate aldolase [candidate division WOR-3 bacterium]|nr:fructose-6-phosphate aldolase [candidate division WOR-3 bacterium]
MKFFIDTANTEEIKEAQNMKLLDGVTTNPTLMAKEIKRTSRKAEEILKEICSITEGPVSAEAISENHEGMIEEAEKLSSIADNICVKIPMTEEGMKAVSTLSEMGIKTNVTLVFTPVQAVIAAKAGANFVSPFIGRLDDIVSEGMDVVEDITDIFFNYDFDTEIIVASIRHPMHVLEAMRTGADIATIPFGVIKKLMKHPLTDAGIRRFLDDYEKSKNM